MLAFIAGLIGAVVLSGASCLLDAIRRRHPWRTADVVAVLAAVSVAAVLRWLVAPAHHAMYVDEPWYAEAACNLLRLGSLVTCERTWVGTACTAYGKAWGWPVLLAPWTAVTGCTGATGIDMNRVLGTASVALVAVAARAGGAAWIPSALAAAVLAIDPLHIEWSATGETNVAAATMLLAGACGALVFLRRGGANAATLAVAALALATAIRPELVVPAVTASAVIALAGRGRPTHRVVAAALALAAAGAAASARSLWSMNESLSGGAFLGLVNVSANLANSAAAASFPGHALVALLAAAGAVKMATVPQQRGPAALFTTMALASAIVVLAYDRLHERMLLSATVCLLPLGAFAFTTRGPQTRPRGPSGVLRFAPAAVLAAVLLAWRHPLAEVSAPPETQLLETRVAARVARLPVASDALLIAAQPTVLASAGSSAMPLGAALADEARLRARIADGPPVYFLCDMYCERDFQGGAGGGGCADVLTRFALEPVLEERLHARTYGLYRFTAATSPGTPVVCPLCER